MTRLRAVSAMAELCSIANWPSISKSTSAWIMSRILYLLCAFCIPNHIKTLADVNSYDPTFEDCFLSRYRPYLLCLYLALA